jgi:3-oxoacyl-[acyl-carrier-protein] synthase II
MTSERVNSDRDALITGIGLISGLGEGARHTHALLAGPQPARPAVEKDKFAPYPVIPMAELDLSTQIPRRGDQRQMGPWQRYGVYAAGLALLLGRTNLIVAAGGGERDPEADALVLDAVRDSKDPAASLTEPLLTNLRPTLFLSQLSNLLAGNISIVHHVTGSSRTFMGEELCGAMALEVAMRRIQCGQGDVFLVGGAYNAEREDMLLFLEIGQHLWQGYPAHAPTPRRAAQGPMPGLRASRPIPDGVMTKPPPAPGLSNSRQHCAAMTTGRWAIFAVRPAPSRQPIWNVSL